MNAFNEFIDINAYINIIPIKVIDNTIKTRLKHFYSVSIITPPILSKITVR